MTLSRAGVAKAINLTEIAKHTRTIHPKIMLFKKDKPSSRSYLYHFDDAHDSRISISPGSRGFRCMQTLPVCNCPLGVPATGSSCPHAGAVACMACHPFFSISGSHPTPFAYSILLLFCVSSRVVRWRMKSRFRYRYYWPR